MINTVNIMFQNLPSFNYLIRGVDLINSAQILTEFISISLGVTKVNRKSISNHF